MVSGGFRKFPFATNRNAESAPGFLSGCCRVLIRVKKSPLKPILIATTIRRIQFAISIAGEWLGKGEGDSRNQFTCTISHLILLFDLL